MAEEEIKLTEKQRIFCHEYIIDWNGARSARVAGYSESSARDIAKENLTKPYIKDYIASIRNNLEEEAGITKLRVIREHEKIAFSSIAHLHDTWITRKEFESLTDDQKSSIAKIDTKIFKKDIALGDGPPDIVDVEHIKVELHDKNRALDSLSKLLGYNQAEKVDITSKGDKISSLSGMTTEDLIKRAEAAKKLES